MTSGRSQMLATRNFGDRHTVVGEVPWSSVSKTTMDCHSKPACVTVQLEVFKWFCDTG